MTPRPVPASDAPPVLRMHGIVKRFGAMTAVDDVDLDIRVGEIHALLGENGAGKSTLMNCLFGLLQPESGSILIDGEPVQIGSPRRAMELGIGMVHQHFKLVPSLTVAENVFLGSEPHSGPFVKDREAERIVGELSREYGLDVDPRARIRTLSVGAQQRVEILRALAKEVRVLVLDEPTAVLTPAETDRFFEVVKNFAARGLAVVLISHHLKEVRRVADRVTVLRRGRKVASTTIGEVTNQHLAELITGESREVVSTVPKGTPGEVRLSIAELRLADADGRDVVHGVSVDVRAGEIVGVLGIAGNGQTELVEAITGLRRPASGTIRVHSVNTTGQQPGRVRAAGLGHIPEDRNGRGMAGYWSVQDNLVAGYLDTREVGWPLLSPRAMAALAKRLMSAYDVRAAGPGQLARRLSGGNAQKLVLARELSRRPEVVVCAEPTRGLDIAASAFVREELLRRRDEGGAVLLVSSEIEEVTEVADRVLVISAGRIVAEFDDERPTEAQVGRAMLEGKQ